MKHLNHKPKTQMETPIKIENRAGKVRLNDIVTKGLIDPPDGSDLHPLRQ